MDTYYDDNYDDNIYDDDITPPLNRWKKVRRIMKI